MNTPRTVRQGHRWFSVTFLVVVILYIVAAAIDEPPVWLVYLPLLPLALLVLSGIYLLALPYRKQAGRAPGEATPSTG